jgi:hypothetical protein
MLLVLLENLRLMGILAILFILSFATNTILGTYYQVNLIKEQFSKEKLLKGLAKGGIILIAGLFITLSLSLLPFGLAEMGITLDEAILEGVSITAVCGVIATGIVHYLKDAITKFYSILTYNHTEE